MKMMYNGTPVNSMRVHHYELDTNDCDIVASDMQAGKTAVARGKKITGTGKSFEFASYGRFVTNRILPIPCSSLNTIIISSIDYETKMDDYIDNLRDLDFSTPKKIGKVLIDGEIYPLTVTIINNLLTFGCDKDITIQAMIGKDNYI